MFDNDVRVVRGSGVDAGIARTRGCSRRRTATSGDDKSQCRAGPNEAIAHVVSSRRSTTPNAPLKADRQEASVPLRADGSPVWAFRSPGLRIAAPGPPSRGVSPQWRLSARGPPLTVARQLRFRTGFPWYPQES